VSFRPIRICRKSRRCGGAVLFLWIHPAGGGHRAFHPAAARKLLDLDHLVFGAIGATVYIIMEMVPDLGLARQSMRCFTRRKRVKMLETIVLDNPSAGNYEELGDLLLEEKRYARARECFDRALSSRTDSLDPFYRRGIATFELCDHAAALSDFKHVVKSIRNTTFRALASSTRALAKTGRKDEASATFEKLIDISTSTETLCAAAEFFAEQHREADAKMLVDRILARRYDHAGVSEAARATLVATSLGARTTAESRRGVISCDQR